MKASGAAEVRPSSVVTEREQGHGKGSRVTAPERCASARKGLAYYRAQEKLWRDKMGAGVTGVGSRNGRTRSTTPARGSIPSSCPRVRYLAKLWREKTRRARVAYVEWHHYQYAWWAWLPDKWQRIGACETGYGKRPGNWRHSNSSYEGAFGFAKSSWDAFKYRADPAAGPYPEDAWQATPRQQYEVALAIWRRYGFSGWGCRNA